MWDSGGNSTREVMTEEIRRKVVQKKRESLCSSLTPRKHDKRLRNVEHQGSRPPGSEGSMPCCQQGPNITSGSTWIDNSFLPHKIHKSDKRSSQSGHGEPHTPEKHDHPSVHPRLSSTPCARKRQEKQSTSPEAYSSQHDSFSDGDSFLANVDLCEIDKPDPYSGDTAQVTLRDCDQLDYNDLFITQQSTQASAHDGDEDDEASQSLLTGGPSKDPSPSLLGNGLLSEDMFFDEGCNRQTNTLCESGITCDIDCEPQECISVGSNLENLPNRTQHNFRNTSKHKQVDKDMQNSDECGGNHSNQCVHTGPAGALVTGHNHHESQHSTIPAALISSNIPVAPTASDQTIKVKTGARHPQCEGGPDKPTSEAPKTPVVPAVSLKDKIKRALQQNVVTPNRDNVQQALQRQQQSVQAAIQTAERIQQEGSSSDVGPFYGLPSRVQQLLEQHRGISSLYDWQQECLSLDAVKQGRNLIYSLPTSGGKTLVAEMLILQQLLCHHKDAVLILPFVAIVQEKVKNLSVFALELDFLLEEYAASKGTIPPKKRRKRQSLYVCTIEKAASLVNSLIELERIGNVGLVVVDELHMLGEGGSRGATLEMTLAKLIYSSSSTQLVGMSATLSNISDISKFLTAEVYSNDFRPVELREYIKIEDMLHEINHKALVPEDRIEFSRVLTFQQDSQSAAMDPDQLTGLVLEVVPQHSCLLFCPTKKNCENVALLICKLMDKSQTEVHKKDRRGLLETLKQEGTGQVCPTLRKTIPYGVAYHHSGLTMDERKLVEEAYTDGALCLLCCTSTLAAGVNLPAKRVILRGPYVGTEFISYSQYKQMAGRAGRAGLDSSGESVVIVNKRDKLKFVEILEGPKDVCISSLLYDEGRGLRRLLLSTIGLKITRTEEEVQAFLQHTLCWLHQDRLGCDLPKLTADALAAVLELGLVVHNKEKQLVVSPLGGAVYKGSIDVDLATRVYQDLCTARESLVVATYLHLLYVVTPYDAAETVRPDWNVYFHEVSRLDPTEMKVANLLGITEAFVTKKAAGRRVRQGPEELVVQRFYLTLMLYSMWQQHTIWDTAARFQMPRGFIQSLLSSAASFASCVCRFCQELEEMWAFQDLLANFVKKLAYCCSQELLPLMEIPGVKLGRAKQLYKAGFHSLQQVAGADPEALVRGIDHMPRRTAKQIVASAQVLLTEKAESLREEADEMVPVSAPDAMATVHTDTMATTQASGHGEMTDTQLMNAVTLDVT